MNMKFYVAQDAGVQSLIQWQYSTGLGDFEHALWEAICKADAGNQLRLFKGFPLHVAAYQNYVGTTGWWQGIKKGLEI